MSVAPAAPAVWTVAITVRNDRKGMVRVLESLVAQSSPPDEVVLVDAFSDDGTWDVIGAFAARAPFPVLIEQHAGSRGAGRTRCVELAKGDVVAFLDSDCVAPPAWLARFREAWARESVVPGAHPLGALGGPYQAPAVSSEFERAVDDVMEPMEAASFGGVNTGNSAYLRSAMLSVGAFDAALHTAEDPDLNARLRRAGYRLVRTDNVVLHERRMSWRKLVRQHYEYGKGGWALIRRYPEYFPFVEVWVAPALVLATLVGIALAFVSPWFLLLTVLGVATFPLVVHRRLAWRFLRQYGAGPRWWRRLGALWVVYLPYHMGILVARLRGVR